MTSLTALLWSGTVTADSVIAPLGCPPGALERGSHSGPYCEPAYCDTEGDCRRVGERCRPFRVCSKRSQFRSRRTRKSFEYQVVYGTCEPSERCTGLEDVPPPIAGEVAEGPPTCEERNFCVSEELPLLPPPDQRRGPAPQPTSADSACRCSSAGEGFGAALLTLPLSLLVLAWVRRR